MENELYLEQLKRRLEQYIDNIKSLNSRLRNEDIEISELSQSIRLLDVAQTKLITELRKKQNEKESRIVHP